MAENPYLKAVGYDTPHDTVTTALSPTGALQFALSKAPAVVGAFVAKKAREWAIKKYPNYKRGSAFVGSVAVLVFAYGFSVAASKYFKTSSRLVDRITDGMLGYVGIDLWDEVKRMVGADKPKGLLTQGAQAPTKPGNSIDGDDDDIRDVASLLANSPETLRFMGYAMFDQMKQEGVEINEPAREAIVRSMQQVNSTIANTR